MNRFTYFEHGWWRMMIDGVEYAGFPWVDRFAAYENTGLKPEEIVAMKNAFMGRELAKITELEGVPITRMRELAQAEKDGRLVIEPPNAPLTLDDLRQMDGEPVWVVFTPDADGERLAMWALVSVDNENDEIVLQNSIAGRSSYKEPRADIETIYRRRPEEVQP